MQGYDSCHIFMSYLSLSLVDPLPQQAARLYDIQKSKLDLIKSTSMEIDNLSLILAYLKDMDDKDELFTDQDEQGRIYESVVSHLKQRTVEHQSNEANPPSTHRQTEIEQIIHRYRQKNTYQSISRDIEVEIKQTIDSKLQFIQHVSEHIHNLRRAIVDLTTKIKAKTVECSVCAEIVHCKLMVTLSQCQHRLCRVCLRRHILSSIERKRETPKCPYPNCQRELRHFDDLQQVLRRRQYEHLNYQLNMTAISKMPGIKYCLTPDCDYCVQYDTTSCSQKVKVTKFECKKCEMVYCLDCKCRWHDGFSSCHAWKRSVKRKKYENYADQKYGKWYKDNRKMVKECPGCHGHVEKNEGCNHMTCRCETEWCWLCGQVFDGVTTTYNHYGFFHAQYDN